MESALDLTLRMAVQGAAQGPTSQRKRPPRTHAVQSMGRIGVRAPVPLGKLPVGNHAQPALPCVDPDELDKSRAQELDELAFAFVVGHPWFWRLFVRFVQDAREAKATIGAKAVVERIRWEHTTRASLRKHDFRVNNTLAASIARIYVRTYPEHQAAFEMRERPSAQAKARGGIA